MTQESAPQLPRFIEAQLPGGIRRRALRVDGQILHVMETGDGFPVWMLHGNPTWGFLYRRVMQALTATPVRCIVPDLAGFGFSSKPKNPAAHTMANHAEWIGALIDQLETDRLLFVGQDWGGPIGIRALADRPDRLAGLVLMNTAVAPPKPGFKPTPFHRFANMPIASNIAFRGFSFPQRMLHKVQGDPESIKGEVAKAYRYPFRRLRDNIAPLALARMVPNAADHPSVAQLEVCRRFLSEFDGPAGIVWGKKDPILGRALKRTTELLPDAPVTETGAGHFLQEEVPDLIADAIRRVVDRLK